MNSLMINVVLSTVKKKKKSQIKNNHIISISTTGRENVERVLCRITIKNIFTL